jgi:hypothetical protein
VRPNNSTNISGADASVNQSGKTLPAENILYISAQAISTGSSTGTVNIQMSNDPSDTLEPDSNGQLQPVNWSNIPTVGTVTITAASVTIIPAFQICAKWVRASYVKNNAEAGTITVNLQTQAA